MGETQETRTATTWLAERALIPAMFVCRILVDGCTHLVNGCAHLIDGCAHLIDGCAHLVGWLARKAGRPTLGIALLDPGQETTDNEEAR